MIGKPRLIELHRKWLREDLEGMKATYQKMMFVGEDPELLEEYKTLAAKVRSWKNFIKLLKYK